MIILAVDPGDTIGIAVIEVPEYTPAKVLTCEEWPTSAEKIDQLYNNWEYTQLVIEDWKDNYGYAEARNTCRAIGMFEMLAYESDVPVRFQPSAFRNNIADDKKALAPLGYWYPNLKSHDDRRQAMRHGLAYVVHTLRHRPTMEWVHPRPS